MNAAHEERFGAVDVADAAHDGLVHEEVADPASAPADLLDHPAGLRAPADGVRAEASENLLANRGGVDRACRRAAEIDGHELRPGRIGLGLQAHPYLAAWVRGGLGALDAELAEEPEMDVADVAGRPLVEQVLAVPRSGLKGCTIHSRSVGAESSLWTRHPDDAPTEQPRLVPCVAVDRMSLGHRDRKYAGGEQVALIRGWSCARLALALRLVDLGEPAQRRQHIEAAAVAEHSAHSSLSCSICG